MKYIKKFEGWVDNSKPKYYVQKGEGYNELVKIKTQILESMNPPIEDVWETISDSLVSLEDNWGKFTTKYDSDKEVVDVGMLDLNVDIKDKSYYTIAHESDTFYSRGNTITIRDREKKEEYRKTKSYNDRLSMYGSNFDQKFYDYYKKVNGKVDPFYSILVKFESEYVNNNIDKMSEMIEDLTRSLNTVMKRLNAKVLSIYYFDNENYMPLNNNWKKVNSLSEVKYPIVEISFKI